MNNPQYRTSVTLSEAENALLEETAKRFGISKNEVLKRGLKLMRQDFKEVRDLHDRS